MSSKRRPPHALTGSLLSLLAFLCIDSAKQLQAAEKRTPPNIVVILTDDKCYSIGPKRENCREDGKKNGNWSSAAILTIPGDSVEFRGTNYTLLHPVPIKNPHPARETR